MSVICEVAFPLEQLGASAVDVAVHPALALLELSGIWSGRVCLDPQLQLTQIEIIEAARSGELLDASPELLALTLMRFENGSPVPALHGTRLQTGWVVPDRDLDFPEMYTDPGEDWHGSVWMLLDREVVWDGLRAWAALPGTGQRHDLLAGARFQTLHPGAI